MFFLTFFVGCSLWLVSPPEGVSPQAWHLFAIFIATIFGMIAKPMPMGAVAFTGLGFVVITRTLPFDVAFSGFSNASVWLIVFAFFIARGFIKTGFGARISYFFMLLFGRKTIGLAYGIVASELVLAPAIPSSTARSGGIILPIIDALSCTYQSRAFDPSSLLMGSYLIKVAIQTSCVTSAMFLTAMAGNPLITDLAADFGIEITWIGWASAALVPGLISCALIPWIIFKISPPGIKETPDAANLARDQLRKMGAVSRNEWIMLTTFILLIVLWIGAKPFNLEPAVAAMLGLVILLVTEVLTWDDIRKESGAWETLVWFAILLMMATQLSKLGFTEWVGKLLVHQVLDLHWSYGFIALSLAYFYSHYLFASNLAHIGAMYATFLSVAIGMGTPPMYAALVFGFFSSLFGALTQYGCGPAAILFGAGFVQISTWWKVGFIMSLINIVIWLGIGSIWWKFLGIW